MSLKISATLFFILFSCNTSFLQNVMPANGIPFNDKVVPRVDITIDPDSLKMLLDDSNLREDHEYLANFYWNDGTNKDTIRQIGFRIRGNTSRTSQKKSFKIKFNHYGSKKFYGLSDFNLNGEHNDPSVIRSKLNWDILKMAGIASSRANHIALYINKEYKGLYVNVEHINDDYFKARHKNPDGQLFKCFYGADFVFKGTNTNAYNKSVYHAENNEPDPDYYTLMEFIKALSDTGNPDYRCQLETKFDVDSYLKTMAMEVLIGHWDNPIFNKNNAYLYFNPENKKYELITFDIDNTYGIDWFGVDWATRNIYSWAHPTDPRPIFNNLLNVQEYKIRYGYYINKFTKEFFNPDFMNAYIDKIKNKIAPFRINDTYAALDYGYSYEDFLKSFDMALGAHVKYGIKDYVKKRYESAGVQLQNIHISPIFEQKNIVRTNTNVRLSCLLTSDTPSEISINYAIDNGAFILQKIKDDGISPDDMANDNKYHINITANTKGVLSYFYLAQEQSGKTSRWPVCGYFTMDIGYAKTPSLFINEFMADNSTIVDEAGMYDDWIEIYNGDAEEVYLGDKYLSDNASLPNKWKMPDITLESHAFMTVWADEDQSQGDFHTNFKLSKSGEFIGIFDVEENYFAPIDTFSFGSCAANKTYGRYPDGKGMSRALDNVTKGTSNVITYTLEEQNKKGILYPNPAFDYLQIDPMYLEAAVDIYNASGQIIYKSQPLPGDGKINVAHWPQGLYIARLSGRHNHMFHFIKL